MNTTPLNNSEQQALIRLARESISSAFKRIPPPNYQCMEESVFSQKCGAFVTLKEGGQLRGCIGRILSSDPLWKTIVEVARDSAFHDRRFLPLSQEELERVNIEISVLSVPWKVKDYQEIEIGVHGIIVSHLQHKALFLPQVPVEQQWDKETYLSFCCRKAGLDQLFWKTGKLTIEVFTAFVFSE